MRGRASTTSEVNDKRPEGGTEPDAGVGGDLDVADQGCAVVSSLKAAKRLGDEPA